jgi:hypothetical protein
MAKSAPKRTPSTVVNRTVILENQACAALRVLPDYSSIAPSWANQPLPLAIGGGRVLPPIAVRDKSGQAFGYFLQRRAPDALLRERWMGSRFALNGR